MAKEPFSGRTDLFKASVHRLEDARVLLDAGRRRAAMYLGGYATECLVKSKLMAVFDCLHLKELEEELQRRGILSTQETIFSHQLSFLIRLTNAIDRLRTNPTCWRQFSIVNRWIPAWRYSRWPAGKSDAEDFLDAVHGLNHWIETNI